MKFSITFKLFLLLISLPLFAQVQGGGEKAWGIDVSLEYSDVYYFRGLVFDDEPGTQLNFTFGVGQITYNFFNRQASGSSTMGLDEQNHAIEMTWLMRGAVQTMGYRFYDYKTDSLSFFRPDTQELFYRIAYLSPWHWTFGTFMDIDAYKGYYFDLSGDRMIPISRRMLIGLKLYVGGAQGLVEEKASDGAIQEYGYYSQNGLTESYAKLYTRYHVSARWTIEAAYTYHKAMDDSLKENPLNDENKNVGSVKVRYVFP